jgi:hypothetical protein
MVVCELKRLLDMAGIKEIYHRLEQAELKYGPKVAAYAIAAMVVYLVIHQ